MKRCPADVRSYFTGLAFLSISLSFITATGQVPELQNSDNYKLTTLNYSNTYGERGTTEFEYDAVGNLVFSRWSLLNGKRNSLNKYLHDEQGLIIEKQRIFSDSVTSRQKFTYNLCGGLIRESFSRSDGINGMVEYQYDAHGRLEGAVCENMNGWFSGYIEYLYNSYEVLDKARIFKGDKAIGEITYQYDINGNLILEIWDFNGTWQQTFLCQYMEVPDRIYTTSNPFILPSAFYRVEEEHYEYSEGVSGPSLYEYDNGRLVKKIFKRSDGLTTESSYHYDDSGTLLSAVRLYSDGKKADFFYEFENNKNMTRRWYKRSDGLDGEERYIYDAQGRLMMAEYKNMDAWLSGTIAFSHDKNGLPVKGFFKGKDHFNADIYFTYDDYKNLIRIQWDFSFGKSQVYTYKYTPLYWQVDISSALF